MDKIFLHELKIDTIIGIWEWERRIRQTVVIDLEMSADIAKAAITDDVADTLNYKAVAKRLQDFVADSSFQLVETLAERVAAIVRDEFGVAWVKVRVNKPGAIRGSKDVGVLLSTPGDGATNPHGLQSGLHANVDHFPSVHRVCRQNAQPATGDIVDEGMELVGRLAYVAEPSRIDAVHQFAVLGFKTRAPLPDGLGNGPDGPVLMSRRQLFIRHRRVRTRAWQIGQLLALAHS